MKKGMTVVALFALLLVAAGCGGGDTTTTTAAPAETTTSAAPETTTTTAALGDVKIGATLPLSGWAANYGVEAQRGTEMAVEEVNAAGGVNGRKVVVIFEDTAADAKQAVTATQKLIEVDKVQAIVGTLFSAEALAQAPIVERAQIPLIVGQANHPDIPGAGEYIFMQNPSAETDGTAMARYAMEVLGKKKAAILAGESAYGRVAIDILQKTFSAGGGEVVFSEIAPMDMADFKTLLGKVKDSGADILFLINLPRTGQIIREESELGMSLPVGGDSMLRDRAVTAEAGDLMEGAFLPMPGPVSAAAVAQSQAFEDLYKQKYGEELQTATPFLAYDSAKLAIAAIQNGGDTGPEMIKWLYSMKDFPGALGEISFSPEGAALRAEYIYKVENGEYVRTDFVIMPGQ